MRILLPRRYLFLLEVAVVVAIVAVVVEVVVVDVLVVTVLVAVVVVVVKSWPEVVNTNRGHSLGQGW